MRRNVLPKFVSALKCSVFLSCNRLHDRKTEHFKALTKNCQASAIADHTTSTGHNIKWEHFEILATGRSDIHCRIKESLLVNENVGS